MLGSWEWSARCSGRIPDESCGLSELEGCGSSLEDLAHTLIDA